jgi:Tfp pilus assembly protein PilV
MSTKTTSYRDIPNDESGMSLIEVIVGALIFAIIAVGAAMGIATSLKMTDDTEARETAIGLASSEIDAVRAMDDPFQVFYDSRAKNVDGREFTITRDTSWVQGAAGSEGCRAGSVSKAAGNLQFKRVNVSVSWAGSLGSTSVARADTVLAPRSRLNDPSKGTILVSVLGADGTGRSGISVSASGPASLANAPASTDSDGCSYILLVAPGTWTVSASRAGYISVDQATTATATVSVTAGTTATAAFQLDAQSTLAPTYPAGTNVPTNLDVSFLSSYGLVVAPQRPTGVTLHPFTSGYSVIAGRYSAPISDASGKVTSNGCQSPDPSTWHAATVNGKNLAAGVRSAPVAAPPGGNSAAPLSMGILAVDAGSTSLRVVAAAANTAVGDPGCDVNAPTYTYSLSATGPTQLAVPFGTWRLESRNGRNWIAVDPSTYAVTTNAAGEIDGANNTTTVDPRQVTP